MNGLYVPKGYTERDFDISSFFLLSYGPRLLHVLQQTSVLPSLSAAYRMVNNANTFKGLKLNATNSETLDELIIQNFERVISKKGSDDCKVWSLKVDEIDVEKTACVIMVLRGDWFV